MKPYIIIIAAAALATACSEQNQYAATGIFEATEITISAESAGNILEMPVEEGDSISAGALIAQIDTMQLYYQKMQLLSQMHASSISRPDVSLQLAATQRELEKQKYERDRVENLLRDGAATSKQLDDINSAIKVLEDRLEAQRSSLSRSSASLDHSAAAIEMQMLRTDDLIADCTVKSPVSGTVLAKYCEAGEYAAPGKPLVKIADLSRMHLTAYYTSEQLADIKPGQQVTVTADFGGDRQYEYPGTITSIASESEFTPKNIQTSDSRSNLVYAVKIAVANDGRIKIGGYGGVNNQ